MRGFRSWWLDTKLGIRMFRKFPVLSLAGVAGIAVAVAIAAGGFSVMQRNFLATSLPLPQGDRVVSLELWDSKAGKPERRVLHDFRNWRDHLQTVVEVSAYRTVTPNLVTPEVPPESVRVAAMSASGFGVARVPPILGRTLRDEDERPGMPPVVVISEEVWRNRLGADPKVLGRTLQLGNTVRAIVGVMPKGFAFPVHHHFWVPLRLHGEGAEPLTGPVLTVFGRLAPGASVGSARAELEAGIQRRALAFRQIYGPLLPRVVPYSQAVLRMSGPDDMAGLLATQGLVLSLLVLVCLNVAILVYTRTAMRQGEIGIRTALGASRGRIVFQLFVEAMVLSAVAAMVGAVAAAFALRQVAAATEPLAADLPFWIRFELSPEAALYAGVLSVLAAVIVGVLPGLQATGRDMQTGLRMTGVGGTGIRLGRIWTALIVVQVAFAVAILPPAVRTGWRTLSAALAGPGFAAEEFLSAHLGYDALDEGAGGPNVSERFEVLQPELIRRLEADPRVAGVTFSLVNPGEEAGARIDSQQTVGEVHEVRYNQVAVNYFSTFAVPVLAGRSWEAADIARSGTAAPSGGDTVIVNESLAQRVFGGRALGQRIRYVAGGVVAASGDPGRWYEIVGIVSDFPKGVSPGMKDGPMKVYHAVGHGQVHPATIVLRLRNVPATFSRQLREVAGEVDAGLYWRDIQSLDGVLRREQWISRLEAGVMLAVTASVVLLSASGIYALLSFTVAQRRREIGVRLALGANRRQILWAVFSRALWQLAMGAMAGALLERGMRRATGEPLDPGEAAVLVAVMLATTTIGLVAVWGPTRLTLQIPPGEVLKEQ